MWVGRSIRRVEDPALVRGEGRFVGDAAIGAAVLRFVRSPVPRGRIRGIDIPSGAVVVTAEDLTEVRPILPRLHREDYVPVAQPILAAERVNFLGEPVAAVLAESAAEAEDLAEQVWVDIEALPAVTDIPSALAEGAPAVHPEAPGNILIDARLETPGFEEAMGKCDHLVEVEFRSHRESATPLETRGSRADFDRRTGRVTLTASVQNPHVVRTGIADLLGMPEGQLRVVAPDVGGAFGQKMSLAREDVLAVWAARRFRRSVAWVEDRRENLLSAWHSRDHQLLLRGAFDAGGRLLALEADICCNVGAYSCYPVTCGVEPLMALAELPGPYDLRHYRVRARAVTTNTCPMAPYRGVARPVITLGMERLMDMAGRRVGLGPVEVRRRNLIDTFPYTSVTGIVYDEGSYRASLERAVELLDLPALRARQEAARREGRLLGIGFSVFSERTGYGTPAFAARSMEITPGYESVEMTMDPSAGVELRIGASPHGQGLETALSQVVADELGLSPERVRVLHGDTDQTPYGWGTFASRSMVLAGGAGKLAAARLRDKLAIVASHLLEAAPEDIVLEDGRAVVKGTDVGVSLEEVARTAYHATHRLEGAAMEPGLTVRATYDPPGTFSNACHAALVEVDAETGQVVVERFLVVEDAGLLVNPMIVDGQIRGGVTQGIAGALFEEVVYDEAGNLLTASLMDYLPPTAAEIPPIEIDHLETVTDASLTGAKGLGEGGTIGAPAAVINAVSDALSPWGIEVLETPATPERIRALLRAAERNVA